MSPLVLYASIVLAILVLAVVARFVIVVPRRECLNCGASISVTARQCRRCGYRYASGSEFGDQERAWEEERSYLDR
jgi:hypothetical protein